MTDEDFDDIVGGLKNAIDRGESPESAAESFIRAGYNREEVKEAIDIVSGEGTNMIPASLNSFGQAAAKPLPEIPKIGKSGGKEISNLLIISSIIVISAIITLIIAYALSRF